MEPSPSTTYSEEYVNNLFENLKWCTAVLAVLLQNEGGVVEIDKESLESIDLNKTFLNVAYDEERGLYTVEGVFNETGE